MTDLKDMVAKMEPCSACDGTGWADRVYRGDWVFGHPKVCMSCNGRAWVKKFDLRQAISETIERMKNDDRGAKP